MKHEHWHKAINDEFEALIRNGTWSLVPPSKGQNIVGCKWLFRIKQHPDGSIARYKARLVAKGYTQCLGVDFKETFAPVVRPQTIKIILTLALAHQWEMHQLDVNNAFLQGALQEQVFMAQPLGLKDPQHPDYVCHLHKAIYGLRQAPRAWHEALKHFILSYGFQTSKSDPSLFIYAVGGTKAYFLVYVDDLLITGMTNSSFTSSLQHYLSGSLSKTWVPLVISWEWNLFQQPWVYFFHSTYIRDLLERFAMEGAKPSSTPLSPTSILQLHDGSSSMDAIECWWIIQCNTFSHKMLLQSNKTFL